MAFRTEKDLMEVALSQLHSISLFDTNQNMLCYHIEPKGLFGIPDFLIAEVAKGVGKKSITSICSFEFKLSNWKRALIQAFRYKAFSNLAIVLLDRDHVTPALVNIEKFHRSNVGLASIDNSGNIIMHFIPEPSTPFSQHLELTVSNIILDESTVTNTFRK